MIGRTVNVEGQRAAYSKQPLTCIIDRSSATAALAKPFPATSLPTTGIIDTEDYGLVTLYFIGGSADGQTTAYQVVAWYGVDSAFSSGGAAYLPIRKVYGTATYGSQTCDAGGVGLTGDSGDFMVDTFTDSADMAGTYIWSHASNDIAFIEVEVGGATAIEVETDITTAKWMSVFAQLGEPGPRKHTDV